MLEILKEWAEGYLFDPGLIDLVVWFPHLSWSEFMASLATVAGWRWISDRIERAVMRRLRVAAARLLMRTALLIRPSQRHA